MALGVERNGQRLAVIDTWENWDGSKHFDAYVPARRVTKACSSLDEALSFVVTILTSKIQVARS